MKTTASLPNTQEELYEAFAAKDYLFDGGLDARYMWRLAGRVELGIKTVSAYNADWRDTIKVLTMQDSCACIVGHTTQPEWAPAAELDEFLDPFDLGCTVLAEASGTLDEYLAEPYPAPSNTWALDRAFDAGSHDSFETLTTAWLIALGRAS